MARANEAMRNLLRYGNAVLPQKMSMFDKSHSYTTTFDSGYIIPIDWDRVLPGDEKQVKFNGFARMATPLHPTMDHCNLDVWAFFVPDRLWYKHAPEFYGENKDADFNEDGEYVMPYLKPSQYAVNPESDRFFNGLGSLNDYFGFPVIYDASTVDDNPDFWASAGLHRSYQLIWNEWFRNSAIQPSLRLNDGDNVTEDEWNEIRTIRLANKYPDYFTTLLKEPQAGEDVQIPLDEFVPVISRAGELVTPLVGRNPMTFYNGLGESIVGGPHNLILNGDEARRVDSESSSQSASNSIQPNNLWARMTDMETATIQNLRNALVIQHFLETKNIAGNRFQSILKAFFGIFTADATLQRPELLGACRKQVGMATVVQNSETTDISALGSLAGISTTSLTNEWISNKVFTEPGFYMVVCCVRPETSYSQGLDPLLTKLNTYEHYWPCFDNIGNQPVYAHNIYANLKQSNVFGYSPAWIEYRTRPNRVTGLMRPDVPNNLSSWNYSTYFNDEPRLNSEFIQTDPELIERTIATPDEPQFILDCWFDYIDKKLMSVHSVPGVDRF